MSARGRGCGGVERRKIVNFSVARQLDLLKKLESAMSVAIVCEEYGMKKQTVSDIKKAKPKLESFTMECSVERAVNTRL